ncbi:MAG: ornithine cyclodeaminase family protein [Bacillota bacterium]
MKLLIVGEKEIRELLPMDGCMAVMDEAFRALARDEAIQPLRSLMWLPGRQGLLGMMPSYLGNIHRFGIKVVSVFPGNHGTPYDSHQGAILLYEQEYGRLLAIMDATAVTAIRTGAVSGVATRALARADAGDLAIIGSGVQAAVHLEAMLHARPIRRVRVWSRTPAKARAFAERASARHGIRVEPMESAEAAVRGADLICTTTSAKEPVLRGEWIAPGAHINAAGSSVATARELDTAAVVRSSLFVDRRESTVNEAGDFLFPKREGAVTDEHIRAELGEVLLGKAPGRRSAEEVTLFKSLGLAVEDLAAAEYVYQQALAKDRGTWVDFGGGREE